MANIDQPSSRPLRMMIGALTGLVLALAAIVLLTVASVFVAVQNERDAGVRGIAEARYIGGSNGGFDLSVEAGAGVLIVIIGGALLGLVLGARPHGRDRSLRDADGFESGTTA